MPNTVKELRQWMNTLENRLVALEVEQGIDRKLYWVIFGCIITYAFKNLFGE